MAAALPDLSVTIAQRGWACVLDPTLALSPLGLPLVRPLCQGMEIWLVREPWHILDDCDLLIAEVIRGGPIARLTAASSPLRWRRDIT